MKRFSQQLKKQSDTIRLKTVEKAALQARLVSFMEYHPLPQTAVRAVSAKRTTLLPSPYQLIAIPVQYVRVFAGIFMLMIIVGVPVLAEQAIPGDILYPVKGVSEEIRSSFNINSYQSVAWESTRLERRIAEARLLAQAGLLTPEVEASVLEAVQVQKATTESEIETLRTTDAEGATLAQMTFATMLDVQSSVLKANDSASTTRGMSTVALADVLEAGRVEITERGDLESVSVERLRAQLEIETTRSYELLESISKVATVKEQADVKRRVADVERAVGAVQSDDSVAQLQLRSAWRDIQKLISFMTDIDVRASIAIETLVPVVLTDGERIALMQHNFEGASANLARIEFGLSSIKDAAVADKVSRSLDTVHSLLGTASTSLMAGNIEGEAAAGEALALTESMLALSSFPTLGDVATTTISTTTQTEVLGDQATSTAGSTSVDRNSDE